MFAKRILLLKQFAEGWSSGGKDACAVLRLEFEDESCTAYLSPVGFRSLTSGEYRLYIWDGKTLCKKSLGNVLRSCVFRTDALISPQNGVAAGIWAESELPVLAAYARTEDCAVKVKEYGKTVINRFIADGKKKSELTEKNRSERSESETAATADDAADNIGNNAPDTDLFSAVSRKITENSVYDDDAITTEDHYGKEIAEKLGIIKEKDFERGKPEDGNDDSPFVAETAEDGENPFGAENEKNACKGGQDYYLNVKDELEKIFSEFPEEKELTACLKDSRWAKVYYAEDKYYVVGLIREDGKEKYICYGVPSVYKPQPPAELAGYCSFVPLSVFDLKGKGYFMMFQDAATGKCVIRG